MAPVRTLATINYAEVVFQCKHQAMHLKNVKIYQFMAPITVKPSLHLKSYNDPALDNCYNIIVLYQSSITQRRRRHLKSGQAIANKRSLVHVHG